MDKDRMIELEAADALLDVGLRLPLFGFRLPRRRRRVEIRVTVHRPTLGTQIRMAKIYMKMGVRADEMAAYDRDEELAFVARHGVAVSKIVALTICRGFLSGLFLTKPVAWLLRHVTDARILMAANMAIVRCIGTRDFIDIIRSVEAANPMKPRLSQKMEGS